jgi:hypothetical protein
MAAPGSFMLLAAVLSVLFGACMLTGAVLLFVGWHGKSRPLQFLSALPFGVGLFIIGPLLLLAIIMVAWWFSADWRGISEPQSPPAHEEQQR